MNFWAHSKNEYGKPHRLETHLRSTAELCSEFTGKWGYPEIGYYLGVTHDAGKFSEQFQNYVRGQGKSVDHSTAGLLEAFAQEDILSLIVGAHHTGLPNLDEYRARLKRAETKKDKYKEEIIKFKEKFEDERDDHIRLPDFSEEADEALKTEFFIRMCFSALVDADFLDTEKHFSPIRFSKRLQNTSDMKELLKSFKKDQKQLMDKSENTKINSLREEIYRKVMDKAEKEMGFFSLTVPTGGGKTRTGIGFALEHARHYDLERVIVVIPYTNIIEQTAEEYRSIFGDENILEHHSSITNDSEKLKLAAENWDIPIVVTTSVQFFESLYANKPGKVRKLHNISNSVVIFDEIQTLPPGLLESIIWGLKEFKREYNTSFIFTTATQPAFNLNKNSINLKNIRELISAPKKLYKKMKRVDIDLQDIENDYSWNEIIKMGESKEQGLYVMNTRNQAFELFQALIKYKKRSHVCHLSNNMCPIHRRNVLKQVKEKLRKGEKCFLVSTQLIEAGVDIDFPFAVRAMGPLDSIVQTAGRCNREGSSKLGKTKVIIPEDNSLPPGVYTTATARTKAFLKHSVDLHNPEIFKDYFSRLYEDVDLDKENIQLYRKQLQFEKAAEKFLFIPERTADIIIENYQGYTDSEKNKLNKILNSVEVKGYLSREEWRNLQVYTVPIYQHDLNNLKAEGMVSEIIEGVYLWGGKYDNKTGLVREISYDSGDLLT